MANEDFQVTLQGGQTLSGTTDDEGYARFEDVEPDQGEVDFVDIPESEEEEETGSSTQSEDDEEIEGGGT